MCNFRLKILAGFMPLLASAQNLELVTTFKDENGEFAELLIDASSIKTISGKKQAWNTIRYRKPQVMGFFPSYSSTRGSYYYDCANGKYARGSFTLYSNDGTVVFKKQKLESDLEFISLVDGSIQAKAFERVCTSAGDTTSLPQSSAKYTGSGFRVADGYFVTHNHVVSGCKSLTVNGKLATIRSVDGKSDLALVSADVAGSVPSIRMQAPQVGEAVSITGYPLRSLLSGFNLTTGNISSLSGIGGDIGMLQLTAPVQPGNSGGPVIDAYGNIIGVVVAKLDALKAAKITGDIPQNVNFAVHPVLLKNFLTTNSLKYKTSSSKVSIPTPEIAEKAKDYTVLLECSG